MEQPPPSCALISERGPFLSVVVTQLVEFVASFGIKGQCPTEYTYNLEEKVPTKFCERGSVMAVGLHIGCPRLVGRQKWEIQTCRNSFAPCSISIQQHLMELKIKYSNVAPGGGAKLDAPPILTILYFVFPFQFDYMTLSTSRKKLGANGRFEWDLLY